MNGFYTLESAINNYSVRLNHLDPGSSRSPHHHADKITELNVLPSKFRTFIFIFDNFCCICN